MTTKQLAMREDPEKHGGRANARALYTTPGYDEQLKGQYDASFSFGIFPYLSNGCLSQQYQLDAAAGFRL